MLFGNGWLIQFLLECHVLEVLKIVLGYAGQMERKKIWKLLTDLIYYGAHFK